MGRQFATALASFCHFTDIAARPQLTAICNRSLTPRRIDWFKDNFPTVKQITDDHTALLANKNIDAVYVAVPHNAHAQIYCDTLNAGKHLLGEKPFGIDLAANESILAAMKANPACHTGVASQYIFYPAVQRILNMLYNRQCGRIIELESGFLHSSDLDPDKPLNWKRTIEANGEYGVMGDLGPHVALVPFRAGWTVENVSAICSSIIDKRPGPDGNLVPCPTWDNVTMLCRMTDPADGADFPWRLRLARIMPGEMNTWYLKILGTKASAEFSLKNPRLLRLLHYTGGEQAWENIDMGYDPQYKTNAGRIFEFGAADAFMQNVAAFIYEIANAKPLSSAAKCPTPEEMHQCHKLFTTALKSNKNGDTVVI
jgi:predicted dehydrogenase